MSSIIRHIPKHKVLIISSVGINKDEWNENKTKLNEK